MSVKDYKPIELTFKLRKLTQKDSWRWKTKQAIKRMKKQILQHYKLSACDADVSISPELNKYIFSNGMKNPPRRVRVRVEAVNSNKDANRRVFRLSHVIVGSFKGLGTEVVVE